MYMWSLETGKTLGSFSFDPGRSVDRSTFGPPNLMGGPCSMHRAIFSRLPGFQHGNLRKKNEILQVRMRFTRRKHVFLHTYHDSMIQKKHDSAQATATHRASHSTDRMVGALAMFRTWDVQQS